MRWSGQESRMVVPNFWPVECFCRGRRRRLQILAVAAVTQRDPPRWRGMRTRREFCAATKSGISHVFRSACCPRAYLTSWLAASSQTTSVADFAQQNARGAWDLRREDRVPKARASISAAQAIPRRFCGGVDDAHEADPPAWSIPRGSRPEGFRRVEDDPGNPQETQNLHCVRSRGRQELLETSAHAETESLALAPQCCRCLLR